MNDDKRYLLAVTLITAILAVWFVIKPPVAPPAARPVTQQAAAVQADANAAPVEQGIALPAIKATRPRDQVLAESKRVKIASAELDGSINLKGALIDDLKLVKYREGLDAASPEITLLSPVGSAAPQSSYYAEIGWLAEAAGTAVPNSETVWKASSSQLTPQSPLKLTWDNGAGLIFERTITLDDHYMFTVTDAVQNKTAADITLFPYALVSRQGNISMLNKAAVIHEGGLGVVDGSLQEYTYAKLSKVKKVTAEGQGGWIGITDKYWLTALVPPQSDQVTTNFIAEGPAKYDPVQTHYQSDMRGQAQKIAAQGKVERTTLFFAGAKTVGQLDDYAKKYGIPHFDRAIDFGWFYFLTKPFLYLLGFLGEKLGSLGIAILVFTVLLKLATLKLSLKSYHSMAKMKALQPQLQRIQEQYADDKARQGQEVMAFYAREKVNPMSGCLPNLVQIPIFFALYKVLYVSLEMRHAPFYGWIKDMSVPDPTTLFNLFGLLPFHPPALLPHVGVWPILMGISMFLQQKMSPQPPDKTQQQMLMFLPLLFTFMLASMPAGLVVYWTWSNLLGILQQWYIMRHDAMQKSRA